LIAFWLFHFDYFKGYLMIMYGLFFYGDDEILQIYIKI